MNSEALLMLAGNLNSYLYEAIGGIRQMPGTTAFRKLLLAPLPVGGLTEAEVSFSPPQGLIRSHWRINSEVFHWTFEIPTDTVAKIKIPDGYAAPVCRNQSGRDCSLEIPLETGIYALTAPPKDRL
jgi:alpha-L-rhamnosidase